MALKKKGLKTINTWQENFEIPGYQAYQMAQRVMDQLRPPQFAAILETRRQIEQLVKPPAFAMLAHNTLEIPGAQAFRQYYETPYTLQWLVEQLKKTQEAVYDFTYENEEDLEATEFELLPAPELIVPEQKIVLVKQLTHIEKIIAKIYKDHNELHRIHHREFEELMAELLRSRGFEVHLTKQTRDGGTDIIALQDLAGSPMKFLIECKQHSLKNKVGVDIIRSFSHVINRQNANKGIIFTTSHFTADAKKEQQSFMPHLLDLRDRNDVLNWVKTYVE